MIWDSSYLENDTKDDIASGWPSEAFLFDPRNVLNIIRDLPHPLTAQQERVSGLLDEYRREALQDYLSSATDEDRCK